jgi:8-oxo-dGTP pyrophosphatase MutT (NUDIX family)
MDRFTEFKSPPALYTLIQTRLEHHHHKIYQYAEVAHREAAVLIPLFYKDDTPCLLFTRRTEKVEHHKGQISFPGGVKDINDEDLQITALRETWEEVGIHKQDVTILGCIDKFLTNTNFMVTPYVGYFSYPYPYRVNSAEISQLIEVPLTHLIRPEIFERKKWPRNGILWDVHYYYYHQEVIWGVTGFLLSDFLSIVFDLKRVP